MYIIYIAYTTGKGNAYPLTLFVYALMNFVLLTRIIIVCGTVSLIVALIFETVISAFSLSRFLKKCIR